jgi:hypothetical protein
MGAESNSAVQSITNDPTTTTATSSATTSSEIFYSTNWIRSLLHAKMIICKNDMEAEHDIDALNEVDSTFLILKNPSEIPHNTWFDAELIEPVYKNNVLQYYRIHSKEFKMNMPSRYRLMTSVPLKRCKGRQFLILGIVKTSKKPTAVLKFRYLRSNSHSHHQNYRL